MRYHDSAYARPAGDLPQPAARMRRSAGMTSSFRVERDSMGEVKVPADALWGAQTQRAVENFPISGLTMPRPFIAALGLVKQAAARANRGLRLLEACVLPRHERSGAGRPAPRPRA